MTFHGIPNFELDWNIPKIIFVVSFRIFTLGGETPEFSLVFFLKWQIENQKSKMKNSRNSP